MKKIIDDYLLNPQASSTRKSLLLRAASTPCTPSQELLVKKIQSSKKHSLHCYEVRSYCKPCGLRRRQNTFHAMPPFHLLAKTRLLALKSGPFKLGQHNKLTKVPYIFVNFE